MKKLETRCVAILLSADTKAAGLQGSQHCRAGGIRGFPSILLDVNGRIAPLATGYATSAALSERLEAALLGGSPKSD